MPEEEKETKESADVFLFASHHAPDPVLYCCMRALSGPSDTEVSVGSLVG